jgi:transposase InsO family protein
VVTAGQQRACVDWICQGYGVSQRRACRAPGRARSTVRYRRRARPGEAALVRAIRRLASRHPLWGYRRAHARLRAEGWSVNLKSLRRLWTQPGLRRPARRKKPRKPGPRSGSSRGGCVSRPAPLKGDVWTCDFIAGRTADGGPLKWLSAVGEYTGECLVLQVDRALTGADVRRALGRAAGRRGAPGRLRCDNGAGFLCGALSGWPPGQGGELTPVAPGRPWENGYVESFHGRPRDEFLEVREFLPVAEARAEAAWFRRGYNRVGPHGAPGYKTPRQFSDGCDQGRHGRPPGPREATREKKLSDPQ